jgi:anti-sigma B factor antagonist
MPGAQAKVRYHQDGPAVTFHVEGRATMTQSLPLRRHAERCLETGTTEVRIDLRDCTYMDSTFVGTLLALHKTLEGGKGRVTILAPSNPCTRILRDLGLFDVLLTDQADHDAAAAWVELPCGSDDATAFKRNIKDAHENLAGLPGPVGKQFEQVVQCMNQADKAAPHPAAPPPAKRPGE